MMSKPQCCQFLDTRIKISLTSSNTHLCDKLLHIGCLISIWPALEWADWTHFIGEICSKEAISISYSGPGDFSQISTASLERGHQAFICHSGCNSETRYQTNRRWSDPYHLPRLCIVNFFFFFFWLKYSRRKWGNRQGNKWDNKKSRKYEDIFGKKRSAEGDKDGSWEESGQASNYI